MAESVARLTIAEIVVTRFGARTFIITNYYTRANDKKTCRILCYTFCVAPLRQRELGPGPVAAVGHVHCDSTGSCRVPGNDDLIRPFLLISPARRLTVRTAEGRPSGLRERPQP